MPTSIKTRFLEKVEKTSTCWIWKAGLTSNGYGKFRIGSRSWIAHRASYELFKGEIPNGMFVCHTCDNPKCVRPGHLFLGTPQDNSSDMVKKGRQARIIGEAHHHHSLTLDQANKIREMEEFGYLRKEIASTFDTSLALVCLVVNNKRYKEMS